MATGIIKFFITDKGYGFIIDDKTKEEIFFHISNVKYDNPIKEDGVSFDIVETERGVKAVNVCMR